MARKPEFRLNRKGVSQALHRMGPAITAKAEAIAASVRADNPGMIVDVQSYTTDRGAASVMVKDPRARELQAREGILTKAAAKNGLQVRSR